MFDAVVGQCSRGLRQLQHGEGVVALANAKRNRLPGVPLLLFGFFIRLALPGLAGQHARQLAIDVDTGNLTKPQRRHEVVHGVYTQLVGQRVVVHVARLDD